MRTSGLVSSILLLLGLCTAGCEPRAGTTTSGLPEEPIDTSQLELSDTSGAPCDPFAGADHIVVLLFTAIDCPISNRYAPEVARLCEQYSERGVDFWLVYPRPSTTAEAAEAHRQEYAYPCPAFRDPDRAVARLCGATITPEAVVFDTNRRLRYRGRINNRYVDFGKTRAQATQHDLADALDALLAGEQVPTPITEAIGCPIYGTAAQRQASD